MYESIEFDIVIFALPDSKQNWPTYVWFSQLLATDTIDYLSVFAGQSVFSVGHAINKDYRYFQYWQNYYSMLQNHSVLKTMDSTQVSEMKLTFFSFFSFFSNLVELSNCLLNQF